MMKVEDIEEMRYLLLNKDLDGRDTLTNINEFEILDLLEV